MAVPPILLWPTVGLTIWTLYCLICLFRNYEAARKTGLPIRVIPIDHTNALWTLLDRKVIDVVRKLPGPLGSNSFTRYNFRTWEFHDRYHSHHEMGDAFILVTPFRNWFYIANPDIITEIFQRRNDFPQCIELTEILDVFGKNLGTVEGKQWQTQRKIIASCFTEQNYEIVWSESISLAQDMLEYWIRKQTLSTSADDLRTLSLHVLTGAGFGRHFKFEGHEERQDSNISANYKNALQTILANCILIMGIGPKVLANIRPWLPKTWKFAILSDTCAQFQHYMTLMYEEEKAKSAQSSTSQKTLISSLVQASQDEAKTGIGLTESEIYGNMFMLNFAGHDTTFHTFTFALHLLAAHPDVQDWVSDEVRAIHTNTQQDSLDSYVNNFPCLVRCLAVMLESLRLYTPIPVAKWTADHSASLEMGGKTIVLPPNTMVIPSHAAVHTEPSIWGSDSLVWRPSRWVKPGDQPGREELIKVREGSFLGWSDGARNCPAKKFSQVEFVATIATLLRDWHVSPVLKAGESQSDAQKRVKDEIDHGSGAVLLLQMLHPERVSLTWSKRSI